MGSDLNRRINWFAISAIKPLWYPYRILGGEATVAGPSALARKYPGDMASNLIALDGIEPSFHWQFPPYDQSCGPLRTRPLYYNAKLGGLRWNRTNASEGLYPTAYFPANT